MEYFSHDYNPRDDEKIRNLMFKHGWFGYGIFWGLVESLYQNDGYMQTHYERLAFDLRTDVDVLKSVICDFDLFKIKGNAFYSESVLHRLKLRKGKSLNAKKAAKARWNKDKPDDASAMQTHSDSNAIKEKEKEIKEKEIKEKLFVDFWELYPNKNAKKKCLEKWMKLKKSDIDKIIETLPLFVKHKPFEKYIHPHPLTYLNQERWNDEIKLSAEELHRQKVIDLNPV